MGKQWSFKEFAENILIEQMEADGRQILQECLAEKDFKDRTKNLRASYGYAVCRRGKVIRWGSNNDWPDEAKKWYGQDIYGGDLIFDFLDPDPQPGSVTDQYKPLTKTFELIIVAAMPYAEPLEFNTGGVRKRKYRVTAMAYGKLRALQQKYGGASVRGILRGKRV